ncbi:hypothetical protein [Merdibacter massiliensis]|uniref:hypothetical protein n=1 Tax=Merdibacter massiliensis TaxID=1871030 RepID=UPI00096A7CE8|nr:hypothetical protein [Merdibacter massiliensis]
MNKKNDMVSSLIETAKVKKHVTTKIEYFCEDTEEVEKVFDKVTELLTTNLDDFAKITFDYSPSENTVDVEVIEHI